MICVASLPDRFYSSTLLLFDNHISLQNLPTQPDLVVAQQTVSEILLPSPLPTIITQSTLANSHAHACHLPKIYLEALPRPQEAHTTMSRLQTLSGSLPKLNIPHLLEKRFSRFLSLPTELRCMVWDLVALQPRNIDVHNVEDVKYDDPKRFNGVLNTPPILLTCREARLVGLKHYERVVEESVRYPQFSQNLYPRININRIRKTSREHFLTQRTIRRAIYLNFQCDNFVIANEIQELEVDSDDDQEDHEDIVFNFSRKDLSKIQHCSMRTDLICVGRLMYLGAFFKVFDVNSIKTFTVEVGSEWKCLCGPEEKEARAAMSSRVEWEKCLREKTVLAKEGLQADGFVYPIEFLWKHAWDTTITFEKFTLGPSDEGEREDDGNEADDEGGEDRNEDEDDEDGW